MTRARSKIMSAKVKRKIKPKKKVKPKRVPAPPHGETPMAGAK